MQIDDYIYAPAIIVGGEAHGTVVEPGRNAIQVAKIRPMDLKAYVQGYDTTGDTRPFVSDSFSYTKTIPIKKIGFYLPFAIDDSEGLTEDHVLQLLRGIIHDIQGRMVEEMYQREEQERRLSPRHWRPRPSILDRRSWVTNFFNKFFPKKSSKYWELNG